MSPKHGAVLRLLTRAEMINVAKGVESGALISPFTGHTLRKHVREALADDLAADLNSLVGTGSDAGMAMWLKLLADERHSVQLAHDEVQLVWTGPEGGSSVSTDTWVAVTDLFRSADDEIVLASYALHGGKELLNELAQRMREIPTLRVRMFLHVHRKYLDTTTSEGALLRMFADNFRQKQWPSDVRRPEIFYDPRTIVADCHRAA